MSTSSLVFSRWDQRSGPCAEINYKVKKSYHRKKQRWFLGNRLQELRKLVAILIVSASLFIWHSHSANRLGSSSTNLSVQPPALQTNIVDRAMLESRLRSALWSFFAGDALAAPTHWYYGGAPQIQRDYGSDMIQDYTQPVYHLPGSIMNKSNINGGGRNSASSRMFALGGKKPNIIGDVINHGKAELWDPTKQIHYHATLARGENTLEVQLARVLMKSIVKNNGDFNPQEFQEDYIQFMTTPGSHNDAYASTCHRMFFRNLVHKELPPNQCPDNDKHNVDTIDGLVLPTIIALSGAAQGKSLERTQQDAVQCVRTTRNSRPLEAAVKSWTKLLYTSLLQDTSLPLDPTLQQVAHDLAYREPSGSRPDEITACYLSTAFPALLDSVAKYAGGSVWAALLANANTGGENVHRGSCLGAVLGARHLMEELEPKLVQGLYEKVELEKEIADFLKAVTETKIL